MSIYNPLIVDADGRLDPDLFRRTFFRALEDYQLSAAPFCLSENDRLMIKAGTYPKTAFLTGNQSTLERRLLQAGKGNGLRGSNADRFNMPQDDVLEELSDIDEDDDGGGGGGSSNPDDYNNKRAHKISNSAGTVEMSGVPRSQLLENPNHISLSDPHPSRVTLSGRDEFPHPLNGRPSSHDGGCQSTQLKIVFDLDNTLLHAQSKYKLNLIEPNLDDFRDPKDRPELYRFVLPRQNTQAYFIKFRPGAIDLIRSVAQYFDLAIHTNATREYADVVLSIIDPDRTIFGGRVAARDDESGKNDRKDMSRLFSINREQLLPSLLIVDDRRDVWDSCFERNIIQCNYYEYFETRRDLLTKKYKSSSRQTNVSNTKLATTTVNATTHGSQETAFSPSSEITASPIDLIDSYLPDNFSNDDDHDNQSLEDCDRQLYFLQQLIVDVAKEHIARRQTNNPRSIADILQERRSKILSGVVALMTGYHKVEQASQFGMLDNGPQHRRRLEYMGATVVDSPSPEVTHVLVMRQTVSTDRARSLCNRNTKFVHNLWIYACEQTWTRVNESFFDATTLLCQWTKPPARPLFEHWTRTRLYYESLMSSGSSSSPGGASKASSTSDTIDSVQAGSNTPTDGGDSLKSDGRVAVNKRRRLSADVTGSGAVQKRKLMARFNRRSSADERPISAITEREWLATGMFSDGAEVWSCEEHVVLRYDPFLSLALIRNNDNSHSLSA